MWVQSPVYDGIVNPAMQWLLCGTAAALRFDASQQYPSCKVSCKRCLVNVVRSLKHTCGSSCSAASSSVCFTALKMS
jgi:hypothetical protein